MWVEAILLFWRRLSFVLLLAVVAFAAVPRHSLAGPGEDARFRSLLARVKQGDRSVDYTALRIAWTYTSFYKPYSNRGAYRRLFQLNAAAKYQEAAAASRALLRDNYLETFAHMVLVDAYKRLGDGTRYAFHLTVARGLIGSLMKSGDGISPQTAYKAVSFNEEYLVLMLRRSRRDGAKALLRWNGRAVDRFEVMNVQTRRRGVIHVDVTPLLARGRH